MFSVFDTEQRVFRNTLEALYKLNPVISASQVDPAQVTLVERQPESAAGQYAPSHNAIEAYKGLVNINDKEQIHHAWEIMETDYEYVSERASAIDAVNKMKSGRYDILPILSADKRAVGLFTYDLIFQKLADLDVAIKGMMLNPVRSFIEDKVITAEPVTSIRRIAEVMYHYNLRIMPITDTYGAVIGIVSYREVLNAISSDPPVSVWT